MRTTKIHFWGAAGTVTGSKYLLETPEINILVDCGMFQGLKELRSKNWEDVPFDASKIEIVLLTHGHLDHTGYLPCLVKQGFSGKIIATAPTLAIAEIILLDSAKIHEEEANKANKEGYSKHHPALPLYSLKEAEQTIKLFTSAERDRSLYLSKHTQCRFRYNGHIIGSTFIEVQIYEKIFLFSGDIGRLSDHLLYDPEKPKWVDYLFLESTYGDRLHPSDSVTEKLTDLINKTIHNGGALIIPSFAVERLQVLMYLLWKLYRERRIPNIPIFIDSPMGANVLHVFGGFPSWHKLPLSELRAVKNRMKLIRSYRDTWNTIDNPQAKVVVAGSGMITGGRVLTYLKQLIDKESTTVLLVGFQAEGTRGRKLLEGAKEVKIFGKTIEVKADIHHIESLSAHADQGELLKWLEGINNFPEKVFLVHGEPAAASVLQRKLKSEFNWNAQIPQLFDTMEVQV